MVGIRCLSGNLFLMKIWNNKDEITGHIYAAQNSNFIPHNPENILIWALCDDWFPLADIASDELVCGF